MARKRYTIFIANGMLTAARSAVKDSALDPRGGGLQEFSVELQRVGGGGANWWGASWVMEETGLGTISFEEFQQTIIDALNMRHNTGQANVQCCTWVEDEFPGQSPREQFDSALADTVKKPWALEEVPAPGP